MKNKKHETSVKTLENWRSVVRKIFVVFSGSGAQHGRRQQLHVGVILEAGVQLVVAVQVLCLDHTAARGHARPVVKDY